MEINIGKYDSTTKKVKVTFTEGTLVFERDVNACLDDKGELDIESTEERVNDVAKGVAHKIAIGVITEVVKPLEIIASEVTTPEEPISETNDTVTDDNV